MTYKLGDLFNGQVINGHYLTLIGVVFGVLMAFFVLMYANYASKRDMKIIPAKGYVIHWHSKPFLASNIGIASLLASVALVSACNNLFHYQGKRSEIFQVISVHTIFYGPSSALIAKLKGEAGTFQFRVDNKDKVHIGNSYRAEIQRGLLGFENVIYYTKQQS